MHVPFLRRWIVQYLHSVPGFTQICAVREAEKGVQASVSSLVRAR